VQSALSAETVYDLLRSHGREEFLLHFAAIIGDFELVIEHWISDEDWEKALNLISTQVVMQLRKKSRIIEPLRRLILKCTINMLLS
jgi:vacuolar protein sorting-associated protein 18